ncbi:MAG: polyphosphate kinase 2 [Pseudomonadota bacterium]
MKTSRTKNTNKKFDLDNPKLPGWIDEGAIESGGYPYDAPMSRKKYEKELEELQIELLKLQNWVQAKKQRIVIVFEGRDASGKGGAIKSIMQHLNPRHARVTALSKPTETEQGEWYYQRYIAELPTAGDILLFDRSWYNRAGVERVMGFCTQEQVKKFLAETPAFENMLARDGILLFKFWLSIGRETQMKRFHARRHDPLKMWKLTEIDLAAISKWDDYTAAEKDIFKNTHTKLAPWTIVRANDKRRTRLNVIRHILSSIDYDKKSSKIVAQADPKIILSGNKYDRAVK